MLHLTAVVLSDVLVFYFDERLLLLCTYARSI